MGFLRKATWVASGGTSGLVFKANSKKERTAKALEQQNRLMKQQLKSEKQRAKQVYKPPKPAIRTKPATAPKVLTKPSFPIASPVTNIEGAAGLAATTRPAQIQADQQVRSASSMANELMKLLALRDEGVLTEAEFNMQKARWLQH